MPNTASFMAPSTTDEIERERIRRRQIMAQAMMQQAQSPIESPMAGGFVARASPLQGLAKLAQAWAGTRMMDRADQEARTLADTRSAALADTLRQFGEASMGTPAQPAIEAPADELGGGPGRPEIPAVPGDMRRAAQILALNPQTQQAGLGLYVKALEPKKPVTVGRSLLNPDTGAVIGVDSTWREEQEATRIARQEAAAAARVARMEDIQMRIDAEERAGRRADELRRELQRQQHAHDRSMREFVIANRVPAQPPQPQIISGEAGPMVMGRDGVARPVIDATTGRQVVGSNTKAAEQMERATERLSKQLETAKVPQVMSSIGTLNNILGGLEQRGESVPGMGYVKNLPMANIFLSDEGKDVKSSVQRVANDLLAMYSGLAVTLPEAERRALEEMRSGAFSADDFTRAWPATVDRFNRVMGNVRAGYDPKIVETYLQRPGAVALDPIKPAFGKNKSGATGDFGGRNPTPGATPQPGIKLPSKADIEAELKRRGQ